MAYSWVPQSLITSGDFQREVHLELRRQQMEREIAFRQWVHDKKSNWIERIQGLKLSLDSLTCTHNCYFYDKSHLKCSFCQTRSKMSWPLKRCIDQMIHNTGSVATTFDEPKQNYCKWVQNFDDVIYNMQIIESEIQQNYELTYRMQVTTIDDAEIHAEYLVAEEFSRCRDVIQVTMGKLKNHHTTTAEQIEALSL